MALTITANPSTGWPPSSQATDCLNGALNEFKSWIHPACTGSILFDIKWIAIGGGVIANNNPADGGNTNYAGIKTILNTTAPTNAVLTSAIASLPVGDPSPVATYKKRGAWNAIINNTSWTGSLGHDILNIDSGTSWDYDPTGQTCSVGKYGLFQVILHELSELCGRVSTLPSFTGVCDLFSFTAANTRSFDQTLTTRYFSWDNGVTNYSSPNSSTFYLGSGSGDACDFNASGDMFGQGVTGNPAIITARDMMVLAAIGLPLSPKAQRIAGIGGSIQP